MTIGWQEQLRPGMALTTIVQQAIAALIAMDAERLEELALCCADLNRGWEENGLSQEAGVHLQSAGSDLELLKRILHETRANLTVLTQLHTIRLREALLLGSQRTVGCADGGAEAFGIWSWERTPGYGDN